MKEQRKGETKNLNVVVNDDEGKLRCLGRRECREGRLESCTRGEQESLTSWEMFGCSCLFLVAHLAPFARVRTYRFFFLSKFASCTGLLLAYKFRLALLLENIPLSLPTLSLPLFSAAHFFIFIFTIFFRHSQERLRITVIRC